MALYKRKEVRQILWNDALTCRYTLPQRTTESLNFAENRAEYF